MIGRIGRGGKIQNSGEEVADTGVLLWSKRRKDASTVRSVSAFSEHLGRHHALVGSNIVHAVARRLKLG